MIRTVLLALGLLLASATASSANIGQCLKVDQLYLRGVASLVGLEAACATIAQAGDRTAIRILGAGYFRAGRLDEAEGWLSRAALLGDATSPFLLAALYQRMGDMKQARAWARRGQQRLMRLRTASGNNSQFTERVERRVERLVGPALDGLIADGRAAATTKETGRNPFVGHWRVGPNANCESTYIALGTDDAASYFFGRRQAYDDVRFDLENREVTLVSGIGRMTLRLVDHDTMVVVRVVEEMSNRVTRSGVVATRCT